MMVFAPIGWEIWLLLFGVALLVGPAMYILETDGEGDSEDFADDMDVKHGPCFGVWHSLISAFGAAPSFSTPNTWLSRFLMLGYAFFTMVFVASYTANMTNFLVANKSPESI